MPTTRLGPLLVESAWGNGPRAIRHRAPGRLNQTAGTRLPLTASDESRVHGVQTVKPPRIGQRRALPTLGGASLTAWTCECAKIGG
jgi:hypothetical protein